MSGNEAKIRYFKCLRCGDCCKTSDIAITAFDVLRMSRHLEKKPEYIITKFCRPGYHPILKDKIVMDDMIGIVFLFKDKPCKFYSNKPIPTCTIHKVKPIVCENTPNPYNPWSISNMYPSCPGLKRSCVFPENERQYYQEICNLHALMLSLTARFFRDTLGLGLYLKELSLSWGETPEKLIASSSEINTYDLIQILDKSMLSSVQSRKDVTKKIIRAFYENRDTLIYNMKNIIIRTVSIDSLVKKFWIFE